mmetsp:Transcript_32429/g.68013  ORF Transcript_32429/g.68013 Transcript_32429/m.68013 type:complete len:212 (+) Transcript_32429:1610-2245(+)
MPAVAVLTTALFQRLATLSLVVVELLDSSTAATASSPVWFESRTSPTVTAVVLESTLAASTVLRAARFMAAYLDLILEISFCFSFFPMVRSLITDCVSLRRRSEMVFSSIAGSTTTSLATATAESLSALTAVVAAALTLPPALLLVEYPSLISANLSCRSFFVKLRFLMTDLISFAFCRSWLIRSLRRDLVDVVECDDGGLVAVLAVGAAM